MSWSVFLVILSAGITFGEYVNGIQNDFNIKAEFAKLAQRVDALETDKTAQADKIRVLETDKAAQADKIRVLETDKATQADKIRVLETDKAAQADKIRVLETDKAAQADKIRVLEQETGELRVKHQESLRMIEDLKSEIKICGQTFEEPATDGEITTAETLENSNHTKGLSTTSESRESVNVQLMRVVPKTKDEQKAVPDIRIKGTDKRRQLVDGNMQIAFTASITPYDYGPLGFEQVLKFDNVVTNIGNAYHPHSGTFIVPVDGVYMFFATIAGGKQHNMSYNYVRIVVNENRVTEMKSIGDQSSQLVILSLRTNDEVYLINRVANDVLLGADYSTFSGALLFAI